MLPSPYSYPGQQYFNVTMSLLLVYLHFTKLVSLILRNNLNLRGKREDFSHTQPAYSGAPKHPSWNWISPSSHPELPFFPPKVALSFSTESLHTPRLPVKNMQERTSYSSLIVNWNYSLKISCPGKRFPCTALPSPALPSPAPRRGCLS